MHASQNHGGRYGVVLNIALNSDVYKFVSSWRDLITYWNNGTYLYKQIYISSGMHRIVNDGRQ